MSVKSAMALLSPKLLKTESPNVLRTELAKTTKQNVALKKKASALSEIVDAPATVKDGARDALIIGSVTLGVGTLRALSKNKSKRIELAAAGGGILAAFMWDSPDLLVGSVSLGSRAFSEFVEEKVGSMVHKVRETATEIANERDTTVNADVARQAAQG